MANTFQKWYNDIHPRYELSNHILTFGLDVLWRKRAAETALQFNRGKSLDVCSGTGDFVYELYRRSENGEAVFACDLTLNMLKRAERRAPEKRIQCAVSEAGALPFPDNTFDFASVTFATRNLNTSRQALTDRFADIRRVLKPGGVFFNLETSQPGSAIIRFFFHLYAKTFVGPIGGFVSGSTQAFRYLAASMQRFYPAEELAEILRNAGFSKVTFRKFFPDVAALHIAKK